MTLSEELITSPGKAVGTTQGLRSSQWLSQGRNRRGVASEVITSPMPIQTCGRARKVTSFH
jgi:hypothetical protein